MSRICKWSRSSYQSLESTATHYTDVTATEVSSTHNVNFLLTTVSLVSSSKCTSVLCSNPHCRVFGFFCSITFTDWCVWMCSALKFSQIKDDQIQSLARCCLALILHFTQKGDTNTLKNVNWITCMVLVVGESETSVGNWHGHKENMYFIQRSHPCLVSKLRIFLLL